MKQKSVLDYIPGFRSRTPWKMILASIAYFILFIIIIGFLVGSSTPSEPTKETTTTSHTKQTVRKEPLEIVQAYYDWEYNSVTFKGEVKNIGSYTIHTYDCKIMIDLYSNGRLVESEYSYINRDIEPGESTMFDVFFYDSSSFDEDRIKVDCG